MTGRRRSLVLLLGALALGGCADRGVVSGPNGSTPATTTAAVVVAVALVVVVLAAIVLTGAWSRGGARLASVVLAAQAAGVWVATAVLLGMAVRGDQLVDHPAEAEQAASLLALSGLDGREPAFFRLMLAAVAVLGGLTLALLALSARLAAGRQPADRIVSCAVLAIETLASALAVGFVLAGDRGQIVLAGAALLPVVAAATWSSWPRSTGAIDAGRVQRRHG